MSEMVGIQKYKKLSNHCQILLESTLYLIHILILEICMIAVTSQNRLFQPCKQE